MYTTKAFWFRIVIKTEAEFEPRRHELPSSFRTLGRTGYDITRTDDLPYFCPEIRAFIHD